MIKLEELRTAMEAIDYRLADMGDYAIMIDHSGEEFGVLWFDNKIEIDITKNVKVYYRLKETTMRILSGGTVSIGTRNSGFFQMYNHGKKRRQKEEEKI